MTETPDWRGLSPYSWLFGWVVARPKRSGKNGRIARRALTRAGAERLARKLNKRDERQNQHWIANGDEPLLKCDWYVLGKIRDHPNRGIINYDPTPPQAP